MKKIIIFLLCLIFVSCFDDGSNKKIQPLKPIEIDINTSNLAVFMNDTLTLKPLVYKEGLSDKKLNFKWELYGGDIVKTTLDSTMVLKAVISAPPYDYYKLKLTVTDENTQIKRIESYYLKVLPPYQTGLIVADTRDGVDSDVSLIMDRTFNSSIQDNKDAKVVRNIWSTNNGHKIPGIVRFLKTKVYGTNSSITIITNKGLWRANSTDYMQINAECNDGMFIIPPERDENGDYGATVIGEYKGTGDQLMIINGKIYPRGVQHNNRLYSFYKFPPEGDDYEVKLLAPPFSGTYLILDSKNAKLMYYNWSGLSYCKTQKEDNIFNVNNLKDYDPIMFGQMNSNTITLLAKRISDNHFLGLNIKTGWSDMDDYASSMFDFSDAQDIENAKYLALNMSEDVLYYATDNKLYSYVIPNQFTSVQWEPEDGSIITGIKTWSDYAGRIDIEDLDPENEKGFQSISTQNRIIIISTYNELTKEGKVTIIPIKNLGAGVLESNKDFHIEYDGFGKILGLYKQD